jgi:hypothetical protein
MSHQLTTARMAQGQPVSLYDMLACNAKPYYTATRQLFEFEEDIKKRISKRDRDSQLSESELRDLRSVLGKTVHYCSKIGLKRAVLRLHVFGRKFQKLDGTLIHDCGLSLDNVRQHLEELQTDIRVDLNDPKFAFIPETFVQYCNNEKLFDNELVEVSKRFPKANIEFTSAGNCFAAEEYTACVFHLMRGLEQGLRALAKAVGVPFPKQYDQKTWGTLIRDIKGNIEKMPKTDRNLDFYNGAASQFRFFQNAWRDYVMHTKEKYPYDYYEAARVMEHARDFMRHIAPRLKELK